MKYSSLGGTGMQVSSLCLGGMMFGEFGEPDHAAAIAVIERALEAGINFIDTADVYSYGESERIIGKALAGRRDDVIVATKFHFSLEVPLGDPSGPVNRKGNSRRWIVTALEQSLERLATDWIDLYQVHRPDPDTDLEETLATLTELQQAGKIRAFGCTTFPAHEVVEAHWIAERRGLRAFATEQPPYSILARAAEADALPVADKYGMGVMSYSPLAAGWLSGRIRGGQDDTTSPRIERTPVRYDFTTPENAPKLAAVEALTELAEEAGLPLIHLALAFAAHHPAVTCPIIGPRTLEHLESQLGAADVVLTGDILDRIDEIVPPGVTLARFDLMHMPVSLTDPRRRRRQI